MPGPSLWGNGQAACLLHVLDFLEVSSALAALQACAMPLASLRPRCLASTHGSLRLAANLSPVGFALLRQRCDEWLRCLRAVREDPRHTFHLHYGCGIAWLGNNRVDMCALELVGSLRGWRPGLPRPSRAGNKRKGIQPVPEHVTAGVDIHLLPAAMDPAVHPKVTLDCRGSQDLEAGLPSDGFMDDGCHDLIMVQACEPGVVVSDSDIATACDLPTPLFVWMLNAHFRIPSNGYATIVFGHIEASSGDFLLASAVFEEFGGLDYEAGEAYFECVTIRSQSWPTMATLLEQCFDSRQTPASCWRHDDVDDSVRTDQFHVTRCFQKNLRNLVMKRLGVSGTQEELARQGVNISHTQDGWTFRHEPMAQDNHGYDFSKPGPLDRIQKSEKHARHLFQKIVGKTAFEELCGRSAKCSAANVSKNRPQSKPKAKTKPRPMKRSAVKANAEAEKRRHRTQPTAKAKASTQKINKSSRTKPAAKVKAKAKVKSKCR